MAPTFSERKMKNFNQVLSRCKELSSAADFYHPGWHIVENKEKNDDASHQMKDISSYSDIYEKMINSFQAIISGFSKYCAQCLHNQSDRYEGQEEVIEEVKVVFEEYFLYIVQYYAHTLSKKNDSVFFGAKDVDELHIYGFLDFDTDLREYVENLKSVNAFISLIASTYVCSNIDQSIGQVLVSKLHEACAEKNVLFVKLLIESGVEVDARKTDNGFTPLHTLCSNLHEYDAGADDNDDIKVADLLISEGRCDANATDYCNRTCLFVLVVDERHRTKLFSYLLQHVDIGKKDKFNRTALFYYYNLDYYIHENNHLSDKDMELINQKDGFGISPLHSFLYHSCSKSDHLIRIISKLDVGRLIAIINRHVVDVNIKSNMGITPLHLALMYDLIEDVMAVSWALLENGADPNISDIYGSTPLHYAIYARPDVALVNVLIEHGADANVRDNVSKNASDLAQDLGYNEYKYCLNRTCPQNNENVKTSVNSSADDDVINTDVVNFVERLMKKVTELDPRFKCQIKLSGSVREGTKTSCPDEFDFQLYLHDLGRICRAECDQKGFAKLILNHALNDENLSYIELFDSGQLLINKKIKQIFYSLVERVLHEQDLWGGTKFVYFPTSLELSGPSLCVQIMFHGGDLKCLRISIDLVLTIPVDSRHVCFKGDVPSETTQLIALYGGCFVLRNQMARLSMSEVEADIMRRIPESIKKGYKQAKLIRSTFTDKRYSYRKIENAHVASHVVQTYALKSALFYILKLHGILNFDGQEGIIISQDESDHDSSYWCRCIYQYNVDHAKGYHFQSFFFPENMIRTDPEKCKQIIKMLTEESSPTQDE